MPTTSKRPNLTGWFAGSFCTVALVVLCDRYLDIPIALWVRDHLFVRAQWSDLTSDLPDLLLQLVLVTTVLSFTLYRLRRRRGLDDTVTRLAQLVYWASPAAYLVKALLKFVFGRVNTRFWLQEPGWYGFHWFQNRVGCEGFPSGHMVVVVTMLAAFTRFYPRWRICSLLVALLLGLALVATDYHFLGDVLAGAFLGLVVEAITYRCLSRGWQASQAPDTGR